VPTFVYSAREREGEVVEATIDADSRVDALTQLRHRGLTATDLVEFGKEPSMTAEPLNKRTPDQNNSGRIIRPGRISQSDKALFCQQLSISVGSGVPLREALESIVDDVENPNFQMVLASIIQDIRDGKTFSMAVKRHQKVFGPLFVALMRSAEEAGSMDTTLAHIAEATEKAEQLSRKVRSIMAYPIFICFFFCIVCVAMTLFVLPKFQEMFSGGGSGLPLITRIVFGANRLIIDNIVLIVVVLAALISALVFYGKSSSGKAAFDRLKLKVPVIGELIKKLAMARFCRNLAIMLRGGVPVATALDISSDVCGNEIVRQSLLQAKEEVLAGNDISSSIARQRIFPRVVVRMIKVGENSGRLPEVLDKVATLYDNQVESQLLLATSLLEPIIICFFGIIITCLVLAIYMPVFSISSGMH